MYSCFSNFTAFCCVDFKWTDDATILLLKEYRKRKDDFKDRTVKKSDLWTDIGLVFLDNGYNVPDTTLNEKLQTLKLTYNRVKDSQDVKKRTGRGYFKWKYFEIMNEIFSGEDDVEVEKVPHIRVKRKVRRDLLEFRTGQLSVKREQVAALHNMQKSLDENTALMKRMVKAHEDRNGILKNLILGLISK